MSTLAERLKTHADDLALGYEIGNGTRREDLIATLREAAAALEAISRLSAANAELARQVCAANERAERERGELAHQARLSIAAACRRAEAAERALQEADKALPCGHHHSLLVKSVESEHSFCELCEARNAQRDAETMEASLLKARDAAYNEAVAECVEKARGTAEQLSQGYEREKAALRTFADTLEAAAHYRALRRTP